MFSFVVIYLGLLLYSYWNFQIIYDTFFRVVWFISVLEDFSNEIIDLYQDLKTEMTSFADMGINYEEKAFYDILKSLSVKYDFSYPEDKLVELAKRAKQEVDSVASFPAWNQRDDIKAELQVKLILLLAEFGYPPIANDDVFKEILEQAENFKKYQVELVD
ncbi:type I restriction enzyme endonuclease domain-containing protein [Microbulbifer sp. TRSA002]|uniref:type I restriction enzyme endonuclease domain-containing protein n=1 Tax=Microbulbifer sp. TRSA002 TaxID=3243382 RepID=UPI0040390804